jgi:N-acetyl-anhydromuramyl-L-alanine amidase AmpD
MTVIKYPSPNQSARPDGTAIDCIVIHADAGKTDQGTISWILKRKSNVSYHYLVTRQGVVYQFVDDDQKAWHAGVSEFKGRKFCNNYSIGVSFANDQKGEAFTSGQVDAGVALVADLCRTYGIPVERVTTHAVVSPGRKVDPGPLFPWATFTARVGAILAETT